MTRANETSTEETMNWWIYKCNSKNRPYQVVYGDWRDFFDKKPSTKTWGCVANTPDLNQLKNGDMIIAYQTNRNELVGTCQMLGFSGKEKSVNLRWVETIGEKVRPLKKSDPQIGNIPALQPGEVKTLYDISPAKAMRLLKKAGASKLGHLATTTNPSIHYEKVRMEGERRAIKTTVRDPRLRADAKAHWGLKCYCCGFEFARFYGEYAKNVAIVHHLSMFKGKRRKVTTQDVRVVCANCHQVIHVRKEPIAVDNLKEQISARWTHWSADGVKLKSGKKL